KPGTAMARSSASSMPSFSSMSPPSAVIAIPVVASVCSRFWAVTMISPALTAPESGLAAVARSAAPSCDVWACAAVARPDTDMETARTEQEIRRMPFITSPLFNNYSKYCSNCYLPVDPGNDFVREQVHGIEAIVLRYAAGIEIAQHVVQ